MNEGSERVLYEKPADGVAKITLNRGDRGNAQDNKLLYAIDAAFSRAGSEDDVKVVIVAAAGEDFSIGHDIDSLLSSDDMAPVTQQGGFDLAGPEGDMAWETEIYLELPWRWRNFPKPTIAQAQGQTMAAGLNILWMCDLIIASEEAEFADPVSAFGVGGVEMFLHPWEFGPRKAKEILFTGDSINAQEAKAGGMVNRVVPRADLDTFTLDLATRIAKRPSFALKMAKRNVNQTMDIQGQWNAVQAAFTTHTLQHAHCRIALDGEYVDPTGFVFHEEWANRLIEKP